MRTRTYLVAAAACCALLLSGCDQVKKLAGGGTPSGQVVATVDGEEITSLQLRAELGNFGSRDPEVMKAAQQQALQRIILRKLMAKAARDEKIDKGTDYTLQVERGQETLLAQLYQRKLSSKTAPPTKQEAEAFVAANPARFANRKVMFVDQVIAAPNKIGPERLQPLKTLDQVKALLDAEGVQYQTNAVVLDSLSANPRLVEGIANLPPGEVFVIPQNGALLFNHVNTTRSLPFTGEMATNYAMNILRQQKGQETVSKQIEAMRKAAESKIVYNDAFKPAPPKKPGAAAAPAKAADGT
ncbi:MAG: hypothetical protein U1C74_13955, partial [Phenylobacterium sp.]|nr:hypothetical protein [Phenylobacterium sp.]